MNAYRTHVLIEDPERVVLPKVPFRPGQRVEVILLAEDRTRLSTELGELFRHTQSLPQSRTVTEDEILAEIAACREGR